MEHQFWTILCITLMAWYVLVTIIVAIFGGRDILAMIRKMKSDNKINEKIPPSKKSSTE